MRLQGPAENFLPQRRINKRNHGLERLLRNLFEAGLRRQGIRSGTRAAMKYEDYYRKMLWGLGLARHFYLREDGRLIPGGVTGKLHEK